MWTTFFDKLKHLNNTNMNSWTSFMSFYRMCSITFKLHQDRKFPHSLIFQKSRNSEVAFHKSFEFLTVCINLRYLMQILSEILTGWDLHSWQLYLQSSEQTWTQLKLYSCSRLQFAPFVSSFHPVALWKALQLCPSQKEKPVPLIRFFSYGLTFWAPFSL